jgi:hypothetical protein
MPAAHVRHPAEGDHRPAEHHEIRVERDELADVMRPDDVAAALPQHEQCAEAEQQRQARVERALQANQAAIAGDVLVVRALEPLEL